MNYQIANYQIVSCQIVSCQIAKCQTGMSRSSPRNEMWCANDSENSLGEPPFDPDSKRKFVS